MRAGIGSDSRIGHSFLYAGPGYGGSCFPKDVNELIMTGDDYDQKLKLLESVHAVNENQKSILIRKIESRFGSDLKGKQIGIWGLAFKTNTDDMRDAPSRVVVNQLLIMGATIKAHVPVALQEAKHWIDKDLTDYPKLKENIEFVIQPYDAVENSEASVIMTK